METVTIGLWATNIEPPAASLAAWAALVDGVTIVDPDQQV